MSNVTTSKHEHDGGQSFLNEMLKIGSGPQENEKDSATLGVLNDSVHPRVVGEAQFSNNGEDKEFEVVSAEDISELEETNNVKVSSTSKDKRPVLIKDSIILKSLAVLNNSEVVEEEELNVSPITNNILPNSKEQFESSEADDSAFAEDYYLDYSLYADYYNNPAQDKDILENDTNVYKFRDYPMEDGYVRIPVHVPGLEMSGFSEPPRLWNAQQAFMEQVGSQLYMFVPAAILGFIVGLLVWIIALVILRIFSVFKRTVLKLFGKEDDKAIDLKVQYLKRDDPWKTISDAEKIHTINGSIRKSVVGPCSPEKVAKFNQEMLETLNHMSSPGGRVELHGLKGGHGDLGRYSVEDKDVCDMFECDEEIGGNRRFSQ